MVASFKRSSSSEDDNSDNNDEGGGRRFSSPNKSLTSYSLITDQRHSASCWLSPKTQRTLPSRGTVHDLFSSSAPSTGAGRGPSANMREESDNGQKEKKTIKSPHQACLLPYPPLLMPVHTNPGSRSPFVSTGLPLAPTSMDYEFGYRDVPVPLSSVGVIPTALGRRSRPTTRTSLPLLRHNGRLPLLSSAGVGGERKREGVGMTVTDSGFVMYHSRPWPGIGVVVDGLVGFYEDTLGETYGAYSISTHLVVGNEHHKH